MGTLASGAAADMFLAEDRVTQRFCALKRAAGSYANIELALKEVSVIQGIHHPHIVQCIDFFFRGTKELYLVYEFMDGGSLRDLIHARGAFALQDASACIAHILSGVAALHQLNIVHCDLKPENILVQFVDGCPVYKVGDFNVAVFMEELAMSDITVEGSPAYMAPERFGDNFSWQSDLYSIGVIFYELLTGGRPFKGKTLEIIQAHQHQDPDLSKINNASIKAMIAKLLNKVPEQRYASAQAALQILKSSHPKASHEQSSKSKQRQGVTLEPQPKKVFWPDLENAKASAQPAHVDYPVERKADYPIYGPASTDSLEELSEFVVPKQVDWIYVAQCEDVPYLALVHAHKLRLYDGVTGKLRHTGKNWVNFEVQPTTPYTLAYRNQHSICHLNTITMEEHVVLRNLDNITGFSYYTASDEVIWTNSRLAHYVRLEGSHTYSFPCMNYGIVPRIRFLANQGLLYSSGPIGSALNIVDRHGSLVDKFLLNGPVISATEGFDKLFFITLSQSDKETYKLYFYDEVSGIAFAVLPEEIQAYTTFGHYVIALLQDGKLRTYRNPTEYAEIPLSGPKNQTVSASLDNRFIFLLRNEGDRWIFRGYRNHETAR